MAEKTRNGVLDLVKFAAAMIVVAVHIIETEWGNFTKAAGQEAPTSTK